MAARRQLPETYAGTEGDGAMTIHFFAQGTPRPKGSHRAFVRGGRAIVTDDNPKGKAWEQAVAKVATRAMCGQPPLEVPLRISMGFLLARPAGHLGAKGLRPSAHPRPTVRPDLDKLVRSCGDALNGVVYADDALVVRLAAEKRYAAPDEMPGVFVKVEVVA